MGGSVAETSYGINDTIFVSVDDVIFSLILQCILQDEILFTKCNASALQCLEIQNMARDCSRQKLDMIYWSQCYASFLLQLQLIATAISDSPQMLMKDHFRLTLFQTAATTETV